MDPGEDGELHEGDYGHKAQELFASPPKNHKIPQAQFSPSLKHALLTSRGPKSSPLRKQKWKRCARALGSSSSPRSISRKRSGASLFVENLCTPREKVQKFDEVSDVSSSVILIELAVVAQQPCQIP